jgi:hypothetical protein
MCFWDGLFRCSDLLIELEALALTDGRINGQHDTNGGDGGADAARATDIEDLESEADDDCDDADGLQVHFEFLCAPQTLLLTDWQERGKHAGVRNPHMPRACGAVRARRARSVCVRPAEPVYHARSARIVVELLDHG